MMNDEPRPLPSLGVNQRALPAVSSPWGIRCSLRTHHHLHGCGRRRPRGERGRERRCERVGASPCGSPRPCRRFASCPGHAAYSAELCHHAPRRPSRCQRRVLTRLRYGTRRAAGVRAHSRRHCRRLPLKRRTLRRFTHTLRAVRRRRPFVLVDSSTLVFASRFERDSLDARLLREEKHPEGVQRRRRRLPRR